MLFTLTSVKSTVYNLDAYYKTMTSIYEIDETENLS